MKGAGTALFVSILLLIAGVINIVYGIGGVSDSKYYSNGAGQTIVFNNLHTWGWMTLIWGVILILAGLSLMGGNAFGWMFGIIAAGIGAVVSLIAVGGPYPFWNLAVFAICLIVIHNLVHLGEPKTK
jgi:hypothetical protein